MATEFVWLRHGVHGGRARFPERSVPSWIKLGWEPCEAPDEDEKTPAAPAAPVKKTTPARLAGPNSKEKADG